MNFLNCFWLVEQPTGSGKLSLIPFRIKKVIDDEPEIPMLPSIIQIEIGYHIPFGYNGIVFIGRSVLDVTIVESAREVLKSLKGKSSGRG
jgi:hypothetical protein